MEHEEKTLKIRKHMKSGFVGGRGGGGVLVGLGGGGGGHQKKRGEGSPESGKKGSHTTTVKLTPRGGKCGKDMSENDKGSPQQGSGC